jgi:hypothetical protein
MEEKCPPKQVLNSGVTGRQGCKKNRVAGASLGAGGVPAGSKEASVLARRASRRVTGS